MGELVEQLLHFFMLVARWLLPTAARYGHNVCYLSLSCSFYSVYLGELLNGAGGGSCLLSYYSGYSTKYMGVRFYLLACYSLLVSSPLRPFAGMRFYLPQYCSGPCALLTYFGNGKATIPM